MEPAIARAALRPARKRRGPRRTLAQQMKDARAAELYLQGCNLREIQEETGARSAGSLSEAIQRGLRDRHGGFTLPRDEELTTLIEWYRMLMREHFKIVAGSWYLTSAAGKIVTIFDEKQGKDVPALDPAPAQRSLVEIRHLVDQIGTFKDLRPATKGKVEHISQDDVNKAIKELTEEMGEASGAQARSGGDSREPRLPRRATPAEG